MAELYDGNGVMTAMYQSPVCETSAEAIRYIVEATTTANVPVTRYWLSNIENAKETNCHRHSTLETLLSVAEMIDADLVFASIPTAFGLVEFSWIRTEKAFRLIASKHPSDSQREAGVIADLGKTLKLA